MTAITALLTASLLVPNVVPGPTAMTAEAVTWTTANSVATGDQDLPSIAMNRNGHVAVVWEDDGTAPPRRTTPAARSTCGCSATAPPPTS
ncbi:hypothetical protein [Micromonospora noduli]|uniref:hypothetical protein n=1 Tax=Micromonospora noduli TaxID=709876 RepID=UPI001CEDF92F|nr:hypothetical protein [Micromonospora noduli]